MSARVQGLSHSLSRSGLTYTAPVSATLAPPMATRPCHTTCPNMGKCETEKNAKAGTVESREDGRVKGHLE